MCSGTASTKDGRTGTSSSEHSERRQAATSGKVHDPEAFYHTGSTPFFASQDDQRFSYALHLPVAHHTTRAELPLVVVVHGTGRTAELYRDALAGFADEHGCVILAPLFPANVGAADDLHGFKFIASNDIRYDHVLLNMVDEVAARYRVDGRRFLLHGFSGGGQFTHRFLYLHPDRLAAASIGAPGRVTMLDAEKPWWIGTADVAARFGRRVDLDALRRVAVQMVVGEADVETWEINNPGGANWMTGADAAGTTRVERLRALHANFAAHDVDARFDLVPGTGHNGARVLPTVERFFAEQLAILAAS